MDMAEAKVSVSEDTKEEVKEEPVVKVSKKFSTKATRGTLDKV